MNTPKLETVEVWGLGALAVGVAYLLYKAYSVAGDAASAVGNAVQNAAGAVVDAAGSARDAVTPSHPALDALPEDASWGQQSAAAASDIPNPISAAISGIGSLYNWAFPQRGGDTPTTVSQVSGTGQNGSNFTGNQEDLR